MVHRPAQWFRILAVLSGIVGVAAVFALNALIHGSLPLWAHIPLTIGALTLVGGSAIITGVAFVEFNARSVKETEQQVH